MIKQSDIETDPDFAYEWATRGIAYERQRIISLIEINRGKPDFTFDSLLNLIDIDDD